MANCHQLFLDFNNTSAGLSLTQSKRDKMENSRSTLREKIRKYFRENHSAYKPKFTTQGSYAMGTAIRTKDDTCDLDDGVYFKSNPEGVSATTLQGWVFDAVDGTTDATPNHRKKCITVDYKAGYNIDLPVLLFNADEDTHPQLAVKDKGFQEDDPKEFLDHYDDVKTAQMTRMIRYLKAWCDHKREKMPSGLSMSVLTMNHFQANERDDVALKFLLINIENELTPDAWQFTCYMPTTPKDDLFDAYSETRKDNFLENLSAFIADARKAVDEPNQLSASKLWQKHLGSRFPDGNDEKEESRAFGLTPIIGPQKPYFEN